MECQNTAWTEMYNVIKIGDQQDRWLTISPPHNDDDPNLYLKAWISKLLPLIHIAHNLILVAEVTNLRLHFHIYYSLKDKVKEYIYLNGWRKHAQLKVYNGEPKEGIDYLFKDIEFTRQYISSPNKIIYDRTDLLLFKQENKRVKHIEIEKTKYD